MSDNREYLDKCNDEGGCPIEKAFYGQELNVGVQVFFGITFLIIFIAQLGLGVKGRMWSFTLWMTLGVGFEVVGYIARIYEAKNPFSFRAYAGELVTLLLAPTFIAAAISVTFKHIVLYYDARWSLFRPKLYPWVFVGTDFVSIFIQFIGAGAAASVAGGGGDENSTVVKIGDGAILGGVIFQVINMLGCSVLMLHYAKRRKSAYKTGKVTRTPTQQQYHMRNLNDAPQMSQPSHDGGYDPEQAHLSDNNPRAATEERRAKIFVWILMLAYALIIIRCTYRSVFALDLGSSVPYLY